MYLRHINVMSLYRKYRANNPNTAFETRNFLCPDGLPRLITLPASHWSKLDRLYRDMPETMNFFSNLCFNTAKRRAKAEAIDFDVALYEVLSYYIFKYNHWLERDRKNIANNYWLPYYRDSFEQRFISYNPSNSQTSF